jgi:alanyl-tRNA synthetase
VQGIKVLAATLEGADAKALRETVDKLKDKLGTGGDRRWPRSRAREVSLIAGVTPDAVARVKAGRAGELRRPAGRRQGRWASRHGAGGRDRPARLGEALASVGGWIAQKA